MPLILYIDTSLELASVFIAKGGDILSIEMNNNPKTHSAFIHLAIKKLLFDTKLFLNQIDALAIINGPGSYTGVRVGLASAKGICFALNKPLIVLNNLKVIAFASVLYLKNNFYELSNALICPMIDARRMEVFTALFEIDLKFKLVPQALIVNDETFSNELKSSKIYFCGNGSFKMKSILNHLNANFIDDLSSSFYDSIIKLAYKSFLDNDFQNVDYVSPFYLKNVFVHTKK
jgi:tRNA threonylcarbamoyladenosine biosynthesis protein TsaB